MGVLFDMFRKKPRQTQTNNVPKFERYDLEDVLDFKIGKVYPLGKNSGFCMTKNQDGSFRFFSDENAKPEERVDLTTVLDISCNRADWESVCEQKAAGQGVLRFQEYGKEGLVNYHGKVVVPANYDMILFFGKFIACKGSFRTDLIDADTLTAKSFEGRIEFLDETRFVFFEKGHYGLAGLYEGVLLAPKYNKIEGVRFADGGLGYRTTNNDQVQYFDKGLNLAKMAQIIDTTRQINN